MENKTTKTPKPPKYILHEGYVYERIPKKKLKEAVTAYVDLQELIITASNGKIAPNLDDVKIKRLSDIAMDDDTLYIGEI